METYATVLACAAALVLFDAGFNVARGSVLTVESIDQETSYDALEALRALGYLD